MSRFLKRAVEALADTLRADLPDALRAVEIEEGLAVDFLTDPAEVAPNPLPNDSRVPLVTAFELGWRWIDQRNGHVEVICAMAVANKGEPNGLAENAEFVRLYIQAMCDVVIADTTLGGQAGAALLTDGDAAGEFNEAQTRLSYQQGVRIDMLQGVTLNNP